MSTHDVVVVGAGNAAMAAALSAAEEGGRVAVLEASGAEDMGGNTRYAAGQMRTVYGGAEDLLQIVPDLTEAEIDNCDFGEYTRSDYMDDLMRMSSYRCDPDLMELVVDNSFETFRWLCRQGVRFQISFGNQAVKVGGRFKFWGGLPCEVWGGGVGLLEAYYRAAEKADVEFFTNTYVNELHHVDGRVAGVNAVVGGEQRHFAAKSVVLACGGFEASAEMRARYLGPNWDLAKVRGTRFNTGAGLLAALDKGARAKGNWSGAHSTPWDVNAPDFGDLEVGDGYQKFSYPLGITVNNKGERFVDEGADYQTYTYARLGKLILEQPGLCAWQIFDNRSSDLLRDEYRIKQVTSITANSIDELAQKLTREGVDGDRLRTTISEFNAAVPANSSRVNLSSKDGRATQGLKLPKSNWACPIDQGPFHAYGVTTGITFTYGGLAISTSAAVLDAAGNPIRGLFAAGEIVGGLFYGGYPGGTGLVSGAVIGRIAGREAARFCRHLSP